MCVFSEVTLKGGQPQPLGGSYDLRSFRSSAFVFVGLMAASPRKQLCSPCTPSAPPENISDLRLPYVTAKPYWHSIGYRAVGWGRSLHDRSVRLVGVTRANPQFAQAMKGWKGSRRRFGVPVRTAVAAVARRASGAASAASTAKAGAATSSAERQRVKCGRLSGKVVRWRGEEGWISGLAEGWCVVDLWEQLSAVEPNRERRTGNGGMVKCKRMHGDSTKKSRGC